jgi:hypothetical protein
MSVQPTGVINSNETETKMPAGVGTSYGGSSTVGSHYRDNAPPSRPSFSYVSQGFTCSAPRTTVEQWEKELDQLSPRQRDEIENEICGRSTMLIDPTDDDVDLSMGRPSPTEMGDRYHSDARNPFLQTESSEILRARPRKQLSDFVTLPQRRRPEAELDTSTDYSVSESLCKTEESVRQQEQATVPQHEGAGDGCDSQDSSVASKPPHIFPMCGAVVETDELRNESVSRMKDVLGNMVLAWRAAKGSNQTSKSSLSLLWSMMSSSTGERSQNETPLADTTAFEMALEQSSESVVLEESFLCQFLRRELFDATAAAVCFVRYWKEKLELFGPDIAFRSGPISIQDIRIDKEALTGGSGDMLDASMGEDWVALSKGGFRVLPSRDQAGRAIVVIDRTRFDHRVTHRKSMVCG